MTETEILNQDESVIQINNNEIIVLSAVDDDHKLYTFDNIFDEESTQEQVYNECAR